ncbi:hypothetical protein C8R46DRAFT_1305075 [Mycena filopes]|nr:hypothetical protein C8R46DRAFT_1305075 [Mycena filopes]
MPRDTGEGKDERGQPERGAGAATGDVPLPTLGGAARHVDTTSASDSTLPTGDARAESASPPGLDVGAVASPQRRGRSRTDKMMLGGGARSPPALRALWKRVRGCGVGAAAAAAAGLGLGRGSYADAAGAVDKAHRRARRQQPQAAEELALGLVPPSSSTALSGGQLLGEESRKVEVAVEMDSGEAEEAEAEKGEEKGEEAQGRGAEARADDSARVAVEMDSGEAEEAEAEKGEEKGEEAQGRGAEAGAAIQGCEVKDADADAEAGAAASQTAVGRKGEQEEDEGTGGARESVAWAEVVTGGAGCCCCGAQGGGAGGEARGGAEEVGCGREEKGDASPREEDVGDCRWC